MSISKKLDETLEALDLTPAAAAARDSVISRSMNNLREKMSKMDIEVEVERPEFEVERKATRYENNRTELADTARKVYRDNINPVDKEAVEKKAPKDQPSTIASRANVTALARSLAGQRSSGNDGKTSFVGPNGSGNVGKLSPTGANDVGNVTNNANNYYALTTDMTLEEYEAYVQTIFEGEDCDKCEHEEMEKKKAEIKARGGPPGKKDPSMKKEDVVFELEQRLVTMGSTDWIVVDQVLREMASELDVAPRTLSREFKAKNGVYPDKWIKEHLDVEICGFMPLEEAARLNKVGTVYEVTFMYRGGTNRLKFFWPMPGEATKEQMQYEVEKFWPKARLLAFYPTIDNEQQSNYIVVAPPMTENYHFMRHDDWNTLSEEASELLEIIYEEEGEPISPILNEENGISVYVEDHDTGEERKINITEEGLRDWFGKSKSSDGKKGWVNVVTGDSCASDKPGEGIPKCVSSSKRASMSEAERKASAAKKRREDPGQQSKSGASKPTNVKTDVKEELSEEKDKKGKGSGKKDACYNKVKSRYSVWPSAYASGALVKCRQKGAKNWGNKSEELEQVDELKCWKGYRRKPGSKPGAPGSCIKEDDIMSEASGGTRESTVDKKANQDRQGVHSGYTANRPWTKKEEPDKSDRSVNTFGGTGKPAGSSTAHKQEYFSNKKKKAQGKAHGKKTVTTEDYDSEKKHEVLKALDKKKGDFKKRYGKDAPDVMYAVAAKTAKKKGDTSKSDDRYAYEQAQIQDLANELFEGDEMKGMSQKSGDKRSTESGAGMTAQGVAKYNRRTGGNLKTAVTTPPSKLKPGSKAAGRRKSFCARSKGWDGERGKAARRRWNC